MVGSGDVGSVGCASTCGGCAVVLVTTTTNLGVMAPKRENEAADHNRHIK